MPTIICGDDNCESEHCAPEPTKRVLAVGTITPATRDTRLSTTTTLENGRPTTFIATI